MKGIDLGRRGSLEEYVGIKYLERQEMLEHLRFVCSYNATNLDRTSQEDVNSFNQLLNKYSETLYPSVKVERKSFAESSKGLLKNMHKMVDDIKKRLMNG